MADQVLSSDFLDLTAFYLAVASVDKILLGLEADPAAFPGIDLAHLQAHRNSADASLRRFSSSVDAGIDTLLRDSTEKAKLRVKTRLDTALRGGAFAGYSSRADFMVFYLPKLRVHTGVIKDVFGTDYSQAMKIAQAAEIESPISRLFKLASIRMTSGKLSILKRWTLEATELCGNPVSEIEAVAVDVVTTDAILDKVAKNERKLDFLDPTDPAAAAAEQENAELLAKVERVAEKSKDPASVKAHAAAKLAQGGEKGGYLTKMSAHLTMTPEQEDAMLVRGKAVIAAGAGSGKTRVLAGKVVHHIQDLGLKMSNVMAVSFTKDSADELQERIEKYAGEIGFPLPDPSRQKEAWEGIGTTHSIGLGILYANKNTEGKIDLFPSFDLSNLMKIAIAQVKMEPSTGQASAPPPDAMTFFPKLPNSGDTTLESPSPIQNPVEEKMPLYDYFQDAAQFKVIVSSAIDTINDFLSMVPRIKIAKTSKTGIYANVLEVYGPGLDRFSDILGQMRINGRNLNFRDADPKYHSPRRFVAFSATPFNQVTAMAELKAAIGADRAENALQALRQFSGADPSKLSDNERNIVTGILSNQSVQDGLALRNIPVKKMASPVASEAGVAKAIQSKLEKIGENKVYGKWLKKPANQWFNIGASDEDMEIEDPRTGDKKPIPPADFTRFVGFNKNSLKAPGALFMDSHGPDEVGVGEDDEEDTTMNKASKRVYAAVYGAYEWLKRDASKNMGGLIEFDDMLVLSTRALIENPQLLAKYQKQYKCILIDEAQDLNDAQHLMFGILAGYIDPSTLKPRADGKMSADTFCFIGDDKQAIYGFRAAAPKRFTEKSDLYEGENEGFTTKLLDTNFRSGSAIVNSANQLISHNKDQIPMVCKTVPDNGEGYIQRLSAQDPEDAADRMTDQILEDLENVHETGKPGKFYSNYGLAVRTNRELYDYAMKMIEKGIPFRSKKNFLGGPVGGIIGLFAITQTIDLKARNAGVLAGVKSPDFGMNSDTLEEKMANLGVGDYYDFLVNQNGAEKIWPGFAKMSRPLQAYADYLKEIYDLRNESAVDIISFITEKKNHDGVTLVDTLSAAILDDEDAMDEIQLEADKTNGIVTQQMIADYALSPIQPLIKATTRFPGATEFANYVGSLLKSNQPNVPKKRKKGESKPAEVAPSERPDAVQLGTIHGWKGLEVRNLYVPMWDGGFPHHRSQGSEKLMEEERRLAYVAITRGQKKVTILEPREVNGKDVDPSQFVEEACIPLNGTAEPQPHPDAFAKNSSFADFRFPDMPASKKAEQDSAGEWLVAQWGRFAHQGEN